MEPAMIHARIDHTSTAAHQHGHGRMLPRDRLSSASLRHYQTMEHLANERTHLMYVRTAVALMALGVIANRGAAYVLADGTTSRDILRTVQLSGLGMVAYGFVLALLAHQRRQRVDRAIDRLAFRAERGLVDFMAYSAIIAGTLALLWLALP
jgi:putative membrane protein